MEQSKGFKDIIFGRAAAENEKNPRYRKLLLEGFLDAYDYTNRLLHDDKFLVLGLKGSGKSAIAARLELLSKERDNLIVTNYDISAEFPHRLFSHLLNLHKDEAQITKFQYYWEYLILVVFLESFSKDNSLIYKNIDAYKSLITALERLELMPTMSFTNLVTKTTKDNFEANLVRVLEGEEQSEIQGSTKGLSIIFNLLREVCYSISGNRKHLLIIDGLDSIMTQQIRQNNIIAALIMISDTINRRFIENDIDAKVILLCRTDLFDILPGANLNKVKQDSALVLNWYQEGVLLNSSNLVKLINLRTKMSLGYDSDFFDEFLPRSIVSGNLTVKTLLDNTRYRPRDLIQILNYIQMNTLGSKPTYQEVWAGIKQYSQDYLLTEIKNELFGFLNDDEREKAINILALMNMSSFNIQQIDEKKNMDSRFSRLDTVKVLQALFNCGAIFNFRKDESGARYIHTAKYRNPTACFDPSEGIRINWGLWKAFNIVEPYDTDL